LRHNRDKKFNFYLGLKELK